LVTVASVSADETLKLWRYFTPTATRNKETTDFESIPTCYKLVRQNMKIRNESRKEVRKGERRKNFDRVL
jgi:hypothetical protein